MPTPVVPVPVRLICWRLPTALSVIVMLPDCVPVAVGVKVILIVHEAFTASVDGLMGQVFVCAYCALAAMLVMLSVALPVLLSVTACDALVKLTGWLGKLRLVGDRVTGELPAVAKPHSGPTVVPVELLTVTYHSYEAPGERLGQVKLVALPERTPVLLASSVKLLPVPCMS